jgi:hypothetical protein
MVPSMAPVLLATAQRPFCWRVLPSSISVLAILQ